ncbi:MAG: A24 family peptidase [Desulfitobacteriaceae bacterium]
MELTELALGLTLGIATWTDWRQRKIYNKLLGPAFLIAFSLQVGQQGWPGVWLSLAGSLVGLALLLIPYLLGGIGAGDVKLLAVIGAFGGVHFVITSFLYGAVLGGIVSIVILIRRKALLATLKHVFLLLPILTRPQPISEALRATCEEKFPYGIVLVLGTILARFVPLGW